jgi:hypothetical protein
MKERYISLAGRKRISNAIPQVYLPSPTTFDYKSGLIRRYFLQARDFKSSPIFEVSETTYAKIINADQYYKGVQLNWRIAGELRDTFFASDDGTLIRTISVVNFNRMAIKEAAKTMPDIALYLVNLKQFYKSSV